MKKEVIQKILNKLPKEFKEKILAKLKAGKKVSLTIKKNKEIKSPYVEK